MDTHTVVFSSETPEFTYYVDQDGLCYLDPSHGEGPVDPIDIRVPHSEPATTVLVHFVGNNLREGFETTHGGCSKPKVIASSTELQCFFEIPTNGWCGWTSEPPPGTEAYVNVTVKVRRVST